MFPMFVTDSRNIFFLNRRAPFDPSQFPRDQLALSLTMVQDVINGRENGHRNLKICELPSPGGVTYGASVLSYLRGLRSTTFTHWAGWKGIRGGWFARKDVNRCANSSGAL
mmetsp:Transcript_21222/g.43460  ORF Transcript_21222/g.43460 Transcript_21222/m.43460 type:complete len:111 (+) Transcript_21222:153-485(+)